MNKHIAIISALLLLATAAFADFGDVLCSWDAPGEGYCAGVAWDGEYIWCNKHSTTYQDMMYRCVASNGSVVSSFETVFGNYFRASGICYRLWSGSPCIEAAVADTLADEYFLYRHNFNGSVVNRLQVHLPGGVGFSSVFYDGQNDWVCEPNAPRSNAYKINGGGSAVSSFTVNQPGATYGITKQGDYFWFPTDSADVYKTRPNGSVVASFKTIASLHDCTYANKKLWVSFGDEIFCFDVSNAPAVAPASIGKIKALYR
ncbi:MAG: hypothetical protein PVH29_11245 [Candidatus Zixiibacteriota bacterium]|jgi:hypothetical protein